MKKLIVALSLALAIDTAALVVVARRQADDAERLRIVSAEIYGEPDPAHLSQHHLNNIEDAIQVAARLCGEDTECRAELVQR